MPLHITKVAYSSESPETLRAWLEGHAAQGEARLTTRYCPKRVEELEGGSLYWIWSHMLIGRSPLLGFQENGAGRYWIRLEPRLVAVQPLPRRAHQGWRYLAGQDAPADLASSEGLAGAERMPAALASELARLGLV